MKKTTVLLLVFCALAAAVSAQKKMKPWTEWNEKDALKILNDSPWGQTQVETDTSEMFYSPTTQSGSGSSSSRNTQGALNQATSINYHIRFLSAKPIRQAVARSMEAKNPQLAAGLRAFVERSFEDLIVVAVTFDSKDGRFSGKALQAFSSANTGLLKNDTYLEIKGGKRIFLEEYKAPIKDDLGAKFIFKKMVDGEPFLRPESNEVRFYSEIPPGIKLNMRFKVAEMMYDGKLEY